MVLKGSEEDKRLRYPVVVLDMADEPEEYIDVEEEKGIGQKKRVVITPCPKRSLRKPCTLAIRRSEKIMVVQEGKVEEYGGKGS